MRYADGYAVRTGQRMREVRRQRGLSLAQVQEASGRQFTASLIGDWERGTRAGHGPRVERLAEYADWLGVDIALLLPPENRTDLLLEATAVRAARNAVEDVAVTFPALSPEKARELVTQALGELGEAS